MKHLPLTSGALLSAALLLAGCGGTNMSSLSGDKTTWLLHNAQIDGQTITVDSPDYPVTLSFADGEAMVGNSAVNKYRAPVTIDSGKIRHTGPIITTRMAGPMPAMRLESAYLKALNKADSIQQSGDTLIISGAGNKLIFTPQQP